jgi:hypothetical protein
MGNRKYKWTNFPLHYIGEKDVWTESKILATKINPSGDSPFKTDG